MEDGGTVPSHEIRLARGLSSHPFRDENKSFRILFKTVGGTVHAPGQLVAWDSPPIIVLTIILLAIIVLTIIVLLAF
jgi:hypothetical protein